MERDFKGVWIPREVWLDERLTALDKMILTEINSLDGEDGCYASNQYLANFCQCSEAKVSKSISLLIELGYVEVVSFDGRKRFLKTCLVKTTSHVENTTQPSKNYKADSENLQHINIDSNIEDNTVTKVTEQAPEKSYGNAEINELFNEWEKQCGFRINSKVKLNRYACQRLIKSYGFERVVRALPFVAESQMDQYAPGINNFMDLAEKWNNLSIWYQKKNVTTFKKHGKIKIPTNERSA